MTWQDALLCAESAAVSGMPGDSAGPPHSGSFASLRWGGVSCEGSSAGAAGGGGWTARSEIPPRREEEKGAPEREPRTLKRVQARNRRSAESGATEGVSIRQQSGGMRGSQSRRIALDA